MSLIDPGWRDLQQMMDQLTGPEPEWWPCLNDCGNRVRRVRAGDGVEPADHPFVHEDGNPVCAITPTAWPKGVRE